MAAYGLYTHIQSNRRRSVLLLIGLFFLVYLMVFAGALLAEGCMGGNRSFDAIMALRRARSGSWRCRSPRSARRSGSPSPGNSTRSMIDALTGGHEVTRDEQPRLYNLLENLCISRGIAYAEAEDHGQRCAQCFRHRPQPEAIFDHGDDRTAQQAERCRNRSRAGTRADAYPQRRRSHDGDRRHHCWCHLVFCRVLLPRDVPRWFRGGGSSGGDNKKGGGGAADPDCRRPRRGGVVPVAGDPLRAVAVTRISGRCRRRAN